MISGTKEQLEQLVKTHICPEHPTLELTVAWNALGSYFIRCGANHVPEEITRRLTRTQEFKAGKLEAVDKAFSLLPKADLATGKELSAEATNALVSYAERYGLDAYRGHVVMMYGKPYIGIDGYLYHATRLKRAYSLQSRPMTTEEEKKYKVGATDHGWLAQVIYLDTEARFNGMGIVTWEEMTAKSSKDQTQLRSPVVAAHPWQLAQKRAEWQAMRRAFPIGESEEQVNEAGDKGSIST